jgi:leucyl-tRNA synthetase
MDDLGYNTAIARLFELNNRLTQVVAERGNAPDEVVAPLVLMTAPLAPHVAEEIWERMGHTETLAFTDFPVADPALLVDETIEIPVQIKGKVRARVQVPAGADAAATEAAARADARIAELLADATVGKVIVVPGKLVNFVTG